MDVVFAPNCVFDGDGSVALCQLLAVYKEYLCDAQTSSAGSGACKLRSGTSALCGGVGPGNRALICTISGVVLDNCADGVHAAVVLREDDGYVGNQGLK